MSGVKSDPTQFCAWLEIFPQIYTPSTDGLPYALQAREFPTWVVFSTLFDSFLAGVAFSALGILRGPQACESEHMVSSTYHLLQNLWHFQVELEQEADDEGPLELHLPTWGWAWEGDFVQNQPASCIQHLFIPGPVRFKRGFLAQQDSLPQAQLKGKTKSDSLMKKKKKEYKLQSQEIQVQITVHHSQGVWPGHTTSLPVKGQSW